MYDENTDIETITVTVRVSNTDEDGEAALAEALDYWNTRFGAGAAHFELGTE